MKLTESKKIISLIGLLFLVVIIIFVLLNRLWAVPNPDDFLLERPGIPKELWPRIVEETQIDSQTKQLTNFYDGYKLQIPINYVYLRPYEAQTGPNVYIYPLDFLKKIAQILQKRTSDLTSFDLVETMPVLEIRTIIKNPQLDLIDWIAQQQVGDSFQKVALDNLPAYKLSRTSSREAEEELHNILTITYYIEHANKDRVYALICSVENGDGDAATEIQQCEEAIQTFEIL